MIFSPRNTFYPSAFSQNGDQSIKNEITKAIVILSSPFATVKDSIQSFLSNIPQTDVFFYFTSDSEVIMQSNLSGEEVGANLNHLISPLPYITEFLNTSSKHVEAFSFLLNSIQLFSGTFFPLCFTTFVDAYLKTNLFQLTSSVCVVFSSIIQ